MAALAVQAQNFIYQDPSNPHKMIVDGKNATKEQWKDWGTAFESVRLTAASNAIEEIDWTRYNIIELKGIAIVGDLDVGAFTDLVRKGVQIIFSGSGSRATVSTKITSELVESLRRIKKEKIQVKPGSVISIPKQGGMFSGTEELAHLCEQVGFKVGFGC